MLLASDLFAEASGRHGRFEQLFLAQDILNNKVNEILDRHGDRFMVRSGDEHDLSLIISEAIGKGLKTFQAIARLCLLGFGEDALVLLRSNINLLINIADILSKENPVERAKDFLAYSYKERVKYLKEAHNVLEPPWTFKMSPDEIKRRAGSWGTIARRAETLPPFHYTKGYRFYSSIEHSDALALDGFIRGWNEAGLTIDSGPSDKHVDLALFHSFNVLADLLMVVCKYLGINRPDTFANLGEIRAKLNRKQKTS